MSSFAEANQAFEAAQTAQTQSAGSEDKVVETSSTQEQASDSTPKVIDIDSLEDKFRFDGKEWTKDDLRKAYLLQQDYTRKTQEIANERRSLEENRQFEVNIRADLKKLVRDPSLISQFKRVYPEKYHAIAEDWLEGRGSTTPQATTDQSAKQVATAELERLERVEKYIESQETKQVQQHLDHTFEKLKAQYPEADELVVIAKAQAKRTRGDNISDADFEKLFKDDHESRAKKLNDYHLAQIKNQKAANKKGRDVPAGGEAPGAPAKKMSFKEATAQAIKDLTNRS